MRLFKELFSPKIVDNFQLMLVLRFWYEDFELVMVCLSYITDYQGSGDIYSTYTCHVGGLEDHTYQPWFFYSPDTPVQPGTAVQEG